MRTAPLRRRILLHSIVAILASPVPVRAGIITVDSTSDENNPVAATITLREAMLIARGSRAPFDLVEGDDEAARVSGSVGAGISDLIEVTLGSQTIVLVAELPLLDDSTDSIDASSFTVVDGSSLKGSGTSGLVLFSNGHTVDGLTLRGFDFGLDVASSGNAVNAMIVEDCGYGVVLNPGADDNDLSNFVVRGCSESGVAIGSAENDLSSFFVHGNQGHGVHFTGLECQANVLRSSSIGITETGAASGNQLWGIAVDDGASFNVCGDPLVDSAFGDVANNALGGIRVSGADTQFNLFHSLRIGYSSTNPGWVGNGAGPGILVTGGATDTLIGKQGANTLVAIGGHQATGIVVEGPDTDGTSIERVDIGGYEPLISAGVPLPNLGHGIEVRDGADDTVIAGPMELRQVDINYTAGNGIFVNGDNPSDPIEGTVLGYYHIGDLGAADDFVIGGDAIRIAGNVDGVVVGGENHRNTTNSGAGWGLHLEGPGVKNIELVRIVTGEGQLGSGTPNNLGGIYVGNGVDGVSFRDAGSGTRSFIHSNLGPGMLLDLSGTPPKNVTVRNASFGLSEFAGPKPNAGGGVVVGEPSGPSTKQGAPRPVVADNVRIGNPGGAATVISGNTGTGLTLRSVSGVKVVNCFVGLDAAGDAARANSGSGILLDNAPGNEIGDPSVANGRNAISGNADAGIYLGHDSYDVSIRGNRIGTNVAGTAARGNGMAGVLVTDIVPPIEEGGELILGELRIGGLSGLLGGGSGLGDGNLISGNTVGILIDDRDGAVSNATIIGNLIGTNLAGTAAVPNTEAGVRVTSSGIGNTFIGDAVAPDVGNLVSGNGQFGIDIDGAGEVRISNCLIGTDAAGTAAIAGQPVGVRLKDASMVELGGTAQNTAMNVISGNAQDGVLIEGTASTVSVSANRIGTNKAGTAAVANGKGVRIVRTADHAVQSVVVGGSNPAVASGAGGSTSQGNLISGNTDAGIRIEGPGTALPSAPGALRIEGNFVGTSLAASAAIANGTGIVVENHSGEGIVVGSENEAARGNVVSGNTMEGIRLAGSTDKITLARNLVGSGANPEAAVANGKDGILADGTAKDCVVARNTIRHNAEHGIRLATSDNGGFRIENNSIHRNVKGGIEFADGANAGIAAPRIDRSRTSSFLIAGTTIPNGHVEVFADPTFSDPGIWGQGRDRVAEMTADGSGAFSIDTRTIERKGIVTTTVRDAMDNTSEFSAAFDVALVQTTAQTPAYLLAGRPTAIRVIGDSGAGGDTHTLAGDATFGGAAIATGDKFVLRRIGYYESNSSEAARGLGSLDFIVPDPAPGMASVEVVVREGADERARIDAGAFDFREIDRDMSMVCVPSSVPASDQPGAPSHTPDTRDITAAGRYFAAIYPVVPAAFLASDNFAIAPPFERRNPLADFGKWSNYCERLEKIRTTTRREGAAPRYVAGFVSSQSGLRDPSIPVGAVVRGAHYSTTPNVALVLDKDARAMPNGESLCHEIGHAPPFLLSDTYINGRTWDQKPAPPLPAEIVHDSTGILSLDEHRAFDPQGLWEDAKCVHPGPVCTAGVRDFMGSASYSWSDPRTDRLLFDAANKSGGKETAIDNALMIAGTLNDDGTGEISPLYTANGPQTPLPSTSPNPYVVEFLDGSDSVLASQPFDAAFFVEILGDDGAEGSIAQHAAASSVAFAVPMGNDGSAVKVRIVREGETVAERTRSDNPPSVELLAPHGPGTISAAPVTVSWTASDPDAGDDANLTFDVYFTPDDGLSRYAVALNETETSVEVDAATLPGGEACRFIVRASDGWNASESQSEPAFTIGDGAPSVSIDYPLASAPIEAGVPFGLSGSAWDAEDGMLMDLSLAWTVDSEPAGNGMTATATLEAGQHTIRLTATDSAANSAFAEVEIEVGQPAPLGLETGWWAITGSGTR